MQIKYLEYTQKQSDYSSFSFTEEEEGTKE